LRSPEAKTRVSLLAIVTSRMAARRSSSFMPFSPWSLLEPVVT
jgi:hypothetical protein